MTELDPDAKALFDLARDALGPPAGAEARTFSKLGAAVGVSGAALAAARSAASQPLTLLGTVGKLALHLVPNSQAVSIAIVALGGSAAGVWGYSVARAPTAHPVAAVASSAARVPRAAPRVAREAAASPSLAPELASALTAPPTAQAEQPSVPAAAPVALRARARADAPAPAPLAMRQLASVAHTGPAAGAVTPSTIQPASPRDAQVQAELQLIREMEASWSTGDDARLGAAIVDHRVRFAAGVLSEEREALHAMLSCRVGSGATSSIYARFTDRYSRSPYEARVRAACRVPAREDQ